VVERWSAQMGEEHGFTTVSHTVELFGFCKNCAIERTDSIRQDE
jgi:Fur family ferric uptake transcriptional regulator